MTDAIKHIDLDHEDFEDAPKALRDYAAKLKQQLESSQSEIKNLRGQVASRAVADVLGDKGFKNPKRVERDLLADGIDPLDTSAVESWLADNSDDYARSENTESPAEPNAQTGVAPEVQAAYGQIGSLGNTLRQPVDMSPLDKAQAEITDDMSPEQVREVLIRNGL